MTAVPWSEGTIARYLTVGGAAVTIIDVTDGALAICQGCPSWTAKAGHDLSRNEYDARIAAHKGAARAAQAHAETCRAMPKPDGAS